MDDPDGFTIEDAKLLVATSIFENIVLRKKIKRLEATITSMAPTVVVPYKPDPNVIKLDEDGEPVVLGEETTLVEVPS